MSGVSVGKRLYVEEYRIWKRNTPFLYDYVVSKALEWPSLTCEWLPGRSKVTGTDYFAQSILLGTHTTGNEQNYLMIADVRSPDYVDEDASEPQGEAGNLPHAGQDPDAVGHVGSKKLTYLFSAVTDGTVKSKLQEVEKVSIVQKINHEGEVNRARAMPQNCFLVATKSPNGQVLVFDTSRHMLKPSIAETCSPQLRLGGHKKEGCAFAIYPLLFRFASYGIECSRRLSAVPTIVSIDMVFAGISEQKGSYCQDQMMR